MYLSRDDARSDFFLAAAVYVIGPTVYALILRSTGSLLTGGLASLVLTVLTPVLLISAMPLYLMRYRGERFRSLLGGPGDAVPLGLAVAAPIVIGTLLGDLAAGNSLLDGFLGTFTVPELLLGRVLDWASLAILTIFLFRRAEYAFRPISERTELLVLRGGAGTLGAAVAASVLLLPTGTSPGLLLAPLGFAGAFGVARKVLPPAGMEEQWRVYAPLITLALGPLDLFSLLTSPLGFLAGLRSAGMVAGFGLLVIMGLLRGKGGRYALTIAGVIALATSVTAFIGGLG